MCKTIHTVIKVIYYNNSEYLINILMCSAIVVYTNNDSLSTRNGSKMKDYENYVCEINDVVGTLKRTILLSVQLIPWSTNSKI